MSVITIGPPRSYGSGPYGAGRYGPMRAAIPEHRSQLYLLEPRIVTSDRDNGPGVDITRHITAAPVDADIDRAGAKSRLQLTTTAPDLVPVTTWVAPYQRIVPETGDIVDAQMGLYQLNDPEITYGNTGHAMAAATGEDIVALLERATMSFPMATKGQPAWPMNVMESVRNAIQLGTAGRGPGVLPNGHFEDGEDGWTLSSSTGFSGSVGIATNTSGAYITGTQALVIQSTSSTVGAYGYAVSDLTTIPPGATKLFLNWGEMTEHVSMQSSVTIRFFDASGAALPTSTIIGSLQTKPFTHANQWFPRLIWGRVPEGAESFRVYALGHDQAPSSTPRAIRFDAFSAGALYGEPFNRIALPLDGRAASTTISHGANTRWLTRINDLLAAIGYHALYATMSGQLTSRPLRDPRTDTPVRTYTFGVDMRIVGDVRVRPSTGNVYNKVIAVKEDHQTGAALVAEARNDDPDHPWSIPRRGEIAPSEPVTVNDAVDQAALQALANDKLARASMQEELAIQVLPDPTLAVHDVIEITGTTGRAAGRWAVESIAWGLTVDDPLVTIGARRTISGKDL